MSQRCPQTPWETRRTSNPARLRPDYFPIADDPAIGGLRDPVSLMHRNTPPETLTLTGKRSPFFPQTARVQ